MYVNILGNNFDEIFKCRRFHFVLEKKKKRTGGSRRPCSGVCNETGGKTAGKVITLEGWHTDPQGAKKKISTVIRPITERRKKKNDTKNSENKRKKRKS
jgi:hypothetical protein